MCRFIELAAEEGEKCAARDRLVCPGIFPDVSGVVSEQNRFWQANQRATQKAYGFWLSNLKYLFFGHKLVY